MFKRLLLLTLACAATACADGCDCSCSGPQTPEVPRSADPGPGFDASTPETSAPVLRPEVAPSAAEVGIEPAPPPAEGSAPAQGSAAADAGFAPAPEGANEALRRVQMRPIQVRELQPNRLPNSVAPRIAQPQVRDLQLRPLPAETTAPGE